MYEVHVALCVFLLTGILLRPMSIDDLHFSLSSDILSIQHKSLFIHLKHSTQIKAWKTIIMSPFLKAASMASWTWPPFLVCVETYAKVLWSNCNIFFFGNSQSGKEEKKKKRPVHGIQLFSWRLHHSFFLKNKTKTICFLRVVIVISELKHDKLSEVSDQTINAQPNCG